jgi:DNA-binding IclR family transcriptional regulator
MGVAAGSLALMSMLPEDVAAGIIEANADRYERHPALRHIGAALIAEQVAEARARGYAINMGYYLPGEGGLGLPVPRRGRYEVNVAVSFNAPLEMMTDAWIAASIDELRDCLGPDLLDKP